MEINELWKRCRDFHGHECKGLLAGFLASLYASQLLGIEFSEDEEIACISECDACPVDAVQAVLGCTVGKGNLLFHMTGKIAFSFYDRKTGKSARLLLTGQIPDFEGIMMEEYCRMNPPSKLFTVKDTAIPLPERARIFDSYICEGCGEKTGANWIHMQNGKKLCPDCAMKYDRFRV